MDELTRTSENGFCDICGEQGTTFDCEDKNCCEKCLENKEQ